MLKLSSSKVKIIKSAFSQWRLLGVLDSATEQRLLSNLSVAPFDWKRLAKYCTWIAIFCLVISVASVVADKVLMELLARIFNLPDALKSLLLAAGSAGVYYAGFRFSKNHPLKIFSLQWIYFSAILLTGGSIAFLGKALDTGTGNFPPLILLAAVSYLLVGLFLKTSFVWLFGLIALATYFGTYSGYVSGWGAYYFGMNYPLRFVLFSGILLALSFALRAEKHLKDFFRPTFIVGLFYMFLSLWILSIFGNYGDMNSWHNTAQIELFHWSLLFAIASAISIAYGLKADDGAARGFGITFLFINLYTRFFEYFWDISHKAIFFGILALSFWYIGTKAEKIWNLEFIKGPKSK